MTEGPMTIDVRPGTSPSSWIATPPSGNDIELLDPGHERYSNHNRLLAEGSRVHDERLDRRFELLCFQEGVVYICRRTSSDGWTVPVALFDGNSYEPDVDTIDESLEHAESMLIGPEERDDLMELSVFLEDRRRNGYKWVDFVIDGKVMRVPTPSNPDFDQHMHEESGAFSAGSGCGPMTHEHSEGIYEYGGHLFKVSDYDIEPYDPDNELPVNWVHPLSMMVDDGNGGEISIGFDEDNEFIEESFWDDEDDAIESGDWDDPDPQMLKIYEVKVRARSDLEDLQIMHHGVDLVGPSASSTLPSGNPWIAFTTRASHDELKAKLFGVERIMVNGCEGLMSDDLTITVALRLSDDDHVYRLTHDWVEVARGAGLNALVGRRYRR